MPIPLLNFVLVLAVLGLLRALAWFHFEVSVEKTELWSVLGFGTMAGLLYQYLPARSKEFVTKKIRQILARQNATRWLSAAAIILFVPALAVSRVEVVWRGPATLSMAVNGAKETFSGEETDQENFSARRYGWSFSEANLAHENWSIKRRLFPLTKTVVQVPFWVTASSSPELRAIQEQLSLVFFQFFEARYLATAKNMLSAPGVAALDKVAVGRLDSVYQILRLSFTEKDVSDSKSLLLSRFVARFPDDPWTPLLRAAIFYASKRYADCAKIAESASKVSEFPKKSTADFFAAICHLRTGRDTADEAQRAALYDRAVTLFRSAYEGMKSDSDEAYRSIAQPSAIHFQGIVNYYRRAIDDALRIFEEAASVADAGGAQAGGIKARALNGVGYLHLSRGRLQQAEIALLKAMDSDSTFPLARSNYGYVLLAKSDLKTAKIVFSRNAADSQLKIESYRDVVLARFALVHVFELEGGKASDVIGRYEPVLQDQKIQLYDGVTPAPFRLAQIHRAIAKSVYLAKDYYGLEVFALALMTRAYLAVRDLADKGIDDARLEEFLDELVAEIAATEAVVSPDWLSRHQSGWFASIQQYRQSKAARDNAGKKTGNSGALDPGLSVGAS